jgi:hypothetical protein
VRSARSGSSSGHPEPSEVDGVRAHQHFEDDGDNGRIAAIGHSAVIAGYARILTIIASILGPIFLGIGSWVAGHAYSAFLAQGVKLEDVRLQINTMAAERRATDASLSQAQSDIRAHDARLLDHEKRITRVEAVAPLAPLLGPRQ